MNSDEQLLKHLSSKLDEESFQKALNRSHLVPIKKLVERNGKQYQTTVYVSPEEAKKEQNKGKKADSPPTRETKDMHFKDGEYTPERQELHTQIISDVFNQCQTPKKGEKPVAVLMGGGSASGKGGIKRRHGITDLADRGIKTGTVDADEIKAQMPEYQSWKDDYPNEAARLAHEESSDIGDTMIDMLIESGKHFIYDGTMKNPKKYQKLVQRLQAAGYETHAYVATCDLDVAKERSAKRAEKTGRKVPEEIIEASHRGVPGAFEKLKDQFDSFQVYDNTDGNDNLIYSNGHINPDMYQKFLDKGNVKFRAID